MGIIGALGSLDAVGAGGLTGKIRWIGRVR